MRILLICHVEKEFGDLQELANRIRSLSNFYDRAISIEFNHCISGSYFPDFYSHEWIYGLYINEMDEEERANWIEGDNYIEVSTHHQYAQITDWMKELNKCDKYTLVGGYRNVCLQDVYEILQHLKLDVKILENYTY